MKKLLKNRVLVASLGIIIVIFVGLVIAWRSALHTLNHMSFKEVTTTQMAASMRLDEFWSNYRFNTLLFDGEVKSISIQNGKTMVSLKTSDTYGVDCVMASPRSNLKVGSTYKFEAETYQAERQSLGVLLHGCINP
jgi:hypothetical protein